MTSQANSAAAADLTATPAQLAATERTVLLFAGARAAVGADQLAVTVPAGATAGQMLAAMAAAAPQLSGLLPACRLAVDRQYVGDDCPLPDGAELALIPPVSGG